MKKNNNQEELFIEKTKHKTLKIIISIMLIVIMILGGYYYYNKINSPQNKYNNIKEAINKKINNNNFLKLDSPLKINGLLKYDIEDSVKYKEIKNIINNLTIQMNGEIDLNNNLSNLNINSKYKDDSFISFQTYKENNMNYLYLFDIFNKYILLDDANIKNISFEEVKSSLKSIILELFNTINPDIIKRNVQTITINKQDIEAFEYTIFLEKEDVIEFFNDYFKKLNNNPKYLNLLKQLNIEEKINEFINIIKQDNNKYEIKIYTKKDFFKNELISIRQTLKSDINITLNFDIIDQENYYLYFQNNDSEKEIYLTLNDSIAKIDKKMKSQEEAIHINASFNYEPVSNVTKESINNSIKKSELNNEEKQIIKENISKNENLEKLINELEKIKELEN